MKRHLPLLLILLSLGTCVSLQAADFASDFSANPVATTPLAKIQLNALTLLNVAQLCGRAFAALRSNRGLVGIYYAIMYGENVPRAIANDYHAEIQVKSNGETKA